MVSGFLSNGYYVSLKGLYVKSYRNCANVAEKIIYNMRYDQQNKKPEELCRTSDF